MGIPALQGGEDSIVTVRIPSGDFIQTHEETESSDTDNCSNELTIKDSSIVLRGFSLPEGVSKVNIINCTVTIESSYDGNKGQKQKTNEFPPESEYKIPVGKKDKVIRKVTDRRGYPGSAGKDNAFRPVIMIIKGED